MSSQNGADQLLLTLDRAALGFGSRTLWEDLDLAVHGGELIAVLGANGSGKSSLLKVVLGQLRLRSGTAKFLGSPVRRGDRRIGYIPQQRLSEDGLPLRGRDLVALGVDGHRWGIPFPSHRRRERVNQLLSSVGAEAYATARLSSLSGGEQQRLRIAQALAAEPRLLLCDEPLLSLDLPHQRLVSDLVDDARRRLNLGVLFVTHDINPILDKVDRVLYIANHRFRIGTPDEVLTTQVLSDLFDAPVEVIRHNGRILVVGVPDLDPYHHPGDAAAAVAGEQVLR
ncbi:ATP-binding cassette domain-containing protein [Streptomyces sp. SID13031]|uniref:metal ABC transporter ATP-binding protein n=1 Tax=Streptomyces sp. SID13031 TaxID=2706046 RepID=UPI0013CD5FC0|nr:ATP-binding cassette domain-containing protein [Streptomyces sp. SID13031]NEA32677.1 ATP-binding cassette domain-containing protein [Streptomyces sp. SID13031]